MRERLLAGLPEGALLVSTAAGCGAALRERDRARARPQRGARARARPAARSAGGEAVAVFDACHLLHAQGVRDAPRDLLRGAGVRAGGARGCRAAAAAPQVCTRSHSRSSRSSSRRAASTAIRESGAEVVSCGNPGCALQLRAALREAQLDVRVAHPAELALEAQT